MYGFVPIILVYCSEYCVWFNACVSSEFSSVGGTYRRPRMFVLCIQPFPCNYLKHFNYTQEIRKSQFDNQY
jgi:hypothetical protein